MSRVEIERAERQRSKYVANIQRGLESALGRARQLLPRLLNIQKDRMVIFSDLHRGVRDGADDFRRCERAYNAALAYFFQKGYTLVVLGDAEELWEERPGPVLEHYAHSLELEAAFHREGRLLRFWGNHDDEWDSPRSVARLLGPIFATPQLVVHEGLVLDVWEGDEKLGEIFLIHGHQGTGASDRFGALARLPVRWIWRPLQRLTGISLNTPASDWGLFTGHNQAMHRWAEKKERFVLIAGHTHRPVFASELHVAETQRELEAVLAELAAKPDDPALIARAAELRAEIEWISAQDGAPGGGAVLPVIRPAYFNTGCCCYRDGDVTGLELAAGMIRLIRCPDDQERPRIKVLTEASIRSVFEACRGESADRGPAAVAQAGA